MRSPRRSIVRCAAILALACAAGAAQAQTMGAAGTARAPGENPDAALVSGAAQSGIDAAALSELAARAASAPEVRRYARTVLHDDDITDKRLAMIAAHENIDLPHALDDEHAALRAQLAELRGPDFDAAYIDAMPADHRRLLGLLESGQSTVRTQALRTYIHATLPTVRDHLAIAQMLRQ